MEHTEPCGFDRGNKCVGLTEKQCDGCPFYKTSAQIEEGRIRSFKILQKAPHADSLIRKYYGMQVASSQPRGETYEQEET